MSWITRALAALPVILLMGCAAKGPPGLPSVETVEADEADTYYFEALQAAKPGYILNNNDHLSVDFLFERQLSTRVRVRPDGAVSLPIVDDVVVAGLTVPELDSLLTTAYGTYFKDPELSINVLEFAPQQVYILGEVARPGHMDLHGGMTMVQALAHVGGPVFGADLNSVVLLRRIGNDKAVARRIDLDAVMNGEGAWDVLLAPSDIIFVPQTFIAGLSEFVQQVFGGLAAGPTLYLRGWEMFHTDLVYGRLVRATGGEAAASQE